MGKPENVKCANCIFWEGYGKDGYGFCHRFPPKPTMTPQRLIEGIAAIYSAISGVQIEDDAIQSFLEPGFVEEYSETSSSEGKSWCGEFKAEWPD